ncbi:hypothetical protein C241_17473 [Bradyrhizobium lupini HPC(L)]|uniref:Uncharacterized protein n=1 Tax=Bradyrhizobium lupini HPC(L) TaxID=1229491 RepID=A0ABN0HJH6_RHILU|nr:hypothetical protein C241_17473 [Bradyrhizobium lupini HPC(L)]
MLPTGQNGAVYAQPSKAASEARPAETAPPKPAPYDDKLARLSEILGAVQYLRTLCPSSGPEDWRKSMGDLLAADTANEPERRQRMTLHSTVDTAPLRPSTPVAHAPPSWQKRTTVTKGQHSLRKSRPGSEIRGLLTSFRRSPCRFDKRLLVLLTGW